MSFQDSGGWGWGVKDGGWETGGWAGRRGGGSSPGPACDREGKPKVTHKARYSVAVRSPTS